MTPDAVTVITMKGCGGTHEQFAGKSPTEPTYTTCCCVCLRV